jgi:hypothetical protein
MYAVYALVDPHSHQCAVMGLIPSKMSGLLNSRTGSHAGASRSCRSGASPWQSPGRSGIHDVLSWEPLLIIRPNTARWAVADVRIREGIGVKGVLLRQQISTCDVGRKTSNTIVLISCQESGDWRVLPSRLHKIGDGVVVPVVAVAITTSIILRTDLVRLERDHQTDERIDKGGLRVAGRPVYRVDG